jgi:hypothetical protein
LQKIDEFSILCSVSTENSYKALSAKIFRLSAEFLSPPTFQNNREPWIGYVKEDVQLDGPIDELTVKSPTVVIDSPDIINDQVNELDVFMNEMENEYEEEEKMEDEFSS